MIDNVDLIIKIIILFLLTATTEISFKKRFWARMILSLAIWVTFFRLTILRAVAFYIGVFGHTDKHTINYIQNILMNDWGVIVTDIIAALGIFACFLITVTEVSKRRRFDKRKFKE